MRKASVLIFNIRPVLIDCNLLYPQSIHTMSISSSSSQDITHIFIFILIIIIFHIFLVITTNNELDIDIKHKIVYHKENTIIHIQKGKLSKKKQKNKIFWDLPYSAVSTPYHLKYRPVRSWPAGLDYTARWNYFLAECAARNVTDVELVNCAYDSEMFRRRLLVKKSCTDYRDDADDEQRINAHKIFAMVNRRLVWCPVYKAASTNWMKNIPRLSDMSVQKVAMLSRKKKNRQANTLARAIVPYIPSQELFEFLKSDPKPVLFIIVRNPFDRLLSAYRDKLERYNKYYYSKYGQKIVRGFRKAGISRFGSKFYDVNGQNGSPMKVPGRKGNEPTFWEFVAAVLKTGLMDEHWKPILDLCSMCAEGMEFDFIIKFEFLSEEERYLVERLGISSVVKERWENRNSVGNTTEQIRDKYFSLLSSEEITQLYNLYQMDFTMFGYDPIYI